MSDEIKIPKEVMLRQIFDEGSFIELEARAFKNGARWMREECAKDVAIWLKDNPYGCDDLEGLQNHIRKVGT